MVNRQQRTSFNATLRPKKRIATYVIRKEEARALKEEVQALRKQLAALQDAKHGVTIELTAAKNQRMREWLHTQQLEIAATSALISSHLSSQGDNPIKAHIHLPMHWSGRRETLMGMKNDKFRQGYAYLTARCHNLDMTKDHVSLDQYEDADGNVFSQRFDVTHFRGVKSLKQVYDALTFFMFNMEISVSETLGDITVREDYDSLEDGAYISNQRLVSNHDSVTSEANTAYFAQYFEGPNEFESLSCVMVATDSIDEDDLHPYNSLEVVRRDVTAAVLLTQERCSRPAQTQSPTSVGKELSQEDSDDDEEIVVVMHRAAFLKTCSPSFNVPENILAEMNERISQWPKVMIQTIREVLDAQS